MVVLCSGIEWPYDMNPCSKEAIGLLERNERLVTWLVPPDGSIKEQVAAIRFKGSLFTLSLRMMKAIYRHVRLHKGFVNVENVNGVLKQRIPELLLREKIRTQSRFDVKALSVPISREFSCGSGHRASVIGGVSTVIVISYGYIEDEVGSYSFLENRR
jgi:hypothetical protein